ncbi:flagellar basal body protein [Methylophilaceae bacterium 11]|nr:flagellar basal body protein [Methylophilaceae bacterium 11]
MLSTNAITPQIVGLALDGLSARHEAIASNIANVNAEGYRPISVSFESQLAGIVARGQMEVGSNDASFSPVVSYGEKQSAEISNASIDMNTVKLNENVIQYHALIKGMQHYMTTLSTAIKEGRG